MVDEGYSLSNTFLRLLGKHYDTTHVVVGHWSFENFERRFAKLWQFYLLAEYFVEVD